MRTLRRNRTMNSISLDDQKIINMVSLQDSLIQMLGQYYFRTCDDTSDIQWDMFPNEEPEECEECGIIHYPIEQFLLEYHDIRENYDSLEPEEISIDLSCHDEMLN